MDEKLRFVARLLDGEKMAPTCREFGISRKTGYKIFHRYKEDGIRGLDVRVPEEVNNYDPYPGRRCRYCKGQLVDMHEVYAKINRSIQLCQQTAEQTAEQTD